LHLLYDMPRFVPEMTFLARAELNLAALRGRQRAVTCRRY
jgi:hypothetical protein